jgi:glycosyltransferase involved in cell wall biosynthesis
MFDALAHGLPFVSSDLGFFKEFAKKGLGIAVRRKAVEFSEALKVLEADYPYYKKQVQRFKSNLTWDSVAREHIRLYVNALEKRHKDWRFAPEVTTQKIL